MQSHIDPSDRHERYVSRKHKKIPNLPFRELDCGLGHGHVTKEKKRRDRYRQHWKQKPAFGSNFIPDWRDPSKHPGKFDD